MTVHYTNEKNVQMLIYLLKEHNVKKIVVSPGAMNVSFVASIQYDDFFEIYSSVDERSAAYMACGLAAESGEPVALSCTGATASRNYLPGLTEAYYRKLPILAITSTQNIAKVGNLYPQLIDRTKIMNDVACYHIDVPNIYTAEDEWLYGLAMNKALIALMDKGGGPVHINLTTSYSSDYSVAVLPVFQTVKKYTYEQDLPELDTEKRIAIFVGAHTKWEDELEKAVDSFCEKYNAVVFMDHTSNYKGKYGVAFNLVAGQSQFKSENLNMDILIHIGEVSGSYLNLCPQNVWRVSLDGEARDYYKKLQYVFQMSEKHFFTHYCKSENTVAKISYYTSCKDEYKEFLSLIPELPFSNIWIAQQLHDKLPQNSVLHLGILNSLRSWNLFEIDKSVNAYSNTGGFGIDGVLSTALGGALANPDQLHFCILGDLAFFYDMNVVGNRHFSSNMRVLIVNNGIGTEFKNYNHPAYKFAKDADLFIAAGGHYGSKSKKLVKDFATNLGVKYISASSKEEFEKNIELFISIYIKEPIIFEVYTDSDKESEALYLMNNLKCSSVNRAKNTIKSIIGEKNVETLKKIKTKVSNIQMKG